MIELMKNIWQKLLVLIQIILLLGGLIAIYININERLARIETDISWIKTEIKNK